MKPYPKADAGIDKRAFCFGSASFFGSASLLLAGTAASAQTSADTSVSPQYIVSYFEVAPASTAAVAKLARDYRAATGKETGAAPFDLFQGTYLPYHFALVGQWRDTAAFTAHGNGAAVKSFRDALAPHLIAPYDERRHQTLAVGNAAPGRSGLVTITHVDIIPTYLQPGIESMKAIVTQSRAEPGCLRFDALTQSGRPNHMTVIQAWRDEASHRRYIVSPLCKAFRETLLARSGSPYDERLYRPLTL